MKFNIKQKERESPRNESLIKLLKSPAIMARSFKQKFSLKAKTQNLKESKTKFLSSDPNELCGRLKLLLQEIQAGNISNTINEEIIAIDDKLLEYKCISKKQHKNLLLKCSN